MPMPTKQKGETKEDFISRFMSDEAMKKEYPDEKQRIAVAYSQFEKQNSISIEEIAAKHGVSIDVIAQQLLKGIEVEKEHVTDPEDTEMPKKIALDHLFEMPDYYDKLEKMEKQNAKQMPKIYYCRHIEKGVTAYENENIFLEDEALNKMDKTMAGVPVKVFHVDKVDVSTIETDSDGFVIESFYCKSDGWHWAKFIAVTDACHDAIQKGWSVSNAYIPTESGAGGECHSVPYDRKILNGKYTHLAIVPNPRYEGAKIFTPEQFEEYKRKKTEELQNAKKGKIMFKFFKKVPIEKDIDENSMVQLENGKEVSLKEMMEVVQNAKKNEDDGKEKDEKLNMDTEIEVGEEKMPIKELVNRYLKASKKNEDEESEEEKKKKAEEAKKNAEEEEKKKKEEEEKQNAAKKLEEIKNAHNMANKDVVIETSQDQLARGKARYGK